ncbi:MULTISPECIES: hypothetical protein [unclassified Pseudomonas]|uniref:hypothetical protein n=1 Tax=unclassified Pseudomonas TaxID=196821 RepID=UPI00053847A8|nr:MULTISPECIES: hypothetical protein [unclassified Pseudomonas]CDF94642.1 hypothetical protein BN844_3662 [Pseudomonas sp. SHC52]
MNTPLFSSHAERLFTLKKTRVDFAVRVLLGQSLEARGINPHTNYLTTLINVSSAEVQSSKTLFDVALGCVEEQVLPHYTQGLSNVFNKRYSFADEDRVKTLDLIEFERIVTDIVTSLAEKPSMDLSWRAIKPLTVEDIHGALNIHLPGLNLDEVHVTSFVTHDFGKRVVSSSQPLAEYLLSHFEQDEIPYHSQGSHQAIHAAAFSESDEHPHPWLTTAHINDLLIRMVPDLLS